MSELGKPFLKKNQITKIKKKQNQCHNAACEQKPSRENKNLIQAKKLGLEWVRNASEKPFRKKSDPTNGKNSKDQSVITACEQKTTSEKANFCSNTIFSLYFKIRTKKCTPQNHSLFRSTSCFGVNHYSNLTSKIMKMCNQVLKKTAPQYNSNSLNCKKPREGQ